MSIRNNGQSWNISISHKVYSKMMYSCLVMGEIKGIVKTTKIKQTLSLHWVFTFIFEGCKVKSIESSFLEVQTVVRKVLFQVLSPAVIQSNMFMVNVTFEQLRSVSYDFYGNS